ncbi:hypothetical protein ONZ45_g11806 [Pleurotus djamor]|nr:hypothetical protein ONZ45_g11806 [Pleurotus djamor]
MRSYVLGLAPELNCCAKSQPRAALEMLQDMSLPPELWSIILRDATNFCDDLDLELLRSNAPKKLAVTLNRAHLATTRNLVRVCRLWNIISSPFLYETLCVTSLPKPEFFEFAGLQRPPVISGKTDSAIERVGLWVKRLIFTFPPLNGRGVDYTILTSVIDQCPNLISFHLLTTFIFLNPGRGTSISMSIDPSESFMAHLSSTTPGLSLQVLNIPGSWETSRIVMSPLGWCTFFDRMAALKAFRIDSCRGIHQMQRKIGRGPWSPDPPKLHPHFIALPPGSLGSPLTHQLFCPDSVKELILRDYDYISDPGVGHQFPSVTHLSLHLSEVTPSERHDLRDVFASYFPSVTHLTLSYASWGNIPEVGMTLSPSVVVLVMASERYLQMPRYLYRRLLVFCKLVAGDSLASIQLKDEQTFIDLSAHHRKVFQSLKDELRARDLALLDWRGKVVH